MRATFTPVAWDKKKDNWIYGGIRSIGKYVGVIDTNDQLRELYLASSNRRKIRHWLREEFGDSIVIVPLDMER